MWYLLAGSTDGPSGAAYAACAHELAVKRDFLPSSNNLSQTNTSCLVNHVSQVVIIAVHNANSLQHPFITWTQVESADSGTMH